MILFWNAVVGFQESFGEIKVVSEKHDSSNELVKSAWPVSTAIIHFSYS